jgi:CDP-diacylglycerol---serine O-phosphatidyltransferase
MIKRNIPNLITCLNLFSGSLAVYYAFQANYEAVLLLVLLAAVFDFLDGFAARLLKAYSPMGKELDSLADVISFGMAPGTVAFSLLKASILPEWLAFAAFIIPVFSALRLAKFNIDERQTSSFIGMPTPANAIFWVGLGYSHDKSFPLNEWIILGLIIVFSLLLVVELPMFSLKIKNFKNKQNILQGIFLAGAGALIGAFKLEAFSLIIIWYIVLSLFKLISKL